MGNKQLDKIIPSGTKFGLLTVIELTKSIFIGSSKVRAYICKCECGTIKTLPSTRLRRYKSCGCIQKLIVKDLFSKHGDYKSKLYRVWGSMKARCNPNSKNPCNIKWYSSRGIKICDEWLEYEPFKEWALSNGYEEGLQIDRRDNNGDYTPSNCRFVTCTVNLNNRESTIFVHFMGENMPIMDAIRSSGWEEKDFGTLHSRFVRGWDAEKAFSTPINKNKNGHRSENTTEV